MGNDTDENDPHELAGHFMEAGYPIRLEQAVRITSERASLWRMVEEIDRMMLANEIDAATAYDRITGLHARFERMIRDEVGTEAFTAVFGPPGCFAAMTDRTMFMAAHDIGWRQRTYRGLLACRSYFRMLAYKGASLSPFAHK